MTSKIGLDGLLERWLIFCRYISNIEMPGGKISYVPMHPPKTGGTQTSSAAEWTIDFAELERAITPRTKMLVLNTPRKPLKSIDDTEFDKLTQPQTTLWARSIQRKS